MSDFLIPFASILSALFAGAGFFFAAHSFKRQTHLTAFLEYSRRFQDLVGDLAFLPLFGANESLGFSYDAAHRL